MRNAMKEITKHLHQEHSDTNKGFIYSVIIPLY